MVVFLCLGFLCFSLDLCILCICIRAIIIMTHLLLQRRSLLLLVLVDWTKIETKIKVINLHLLRHIWCRRRNSSLMCRVTIKSRYFWLLHRNVKVIKRSKGPGGTSRPHCRRKCRLMRTTKTSQLELWKRPCSISRPHASQNGTDHKIPLCTVCAAPIKSPLKFLHISKRNDQVESAGTNPPPEGSSSLLLFSLWPLLPYAHPLLLNRRRPRSCKLHARWPGNWIGNGTMI